MWTSSSGGGKEDEEDDGVSIYFRVDAIPVPGQKFITQDWFVFKSGSGGGVGGSAREAMSPVFPRQPKILRQSSCVAVDSFIYVIGGDDPDNRRRFEPKRLRDVYYIDTLDPDSGWKKLAYLHTPRAGALAFFVNGVIYVMGGYREFIDDGVEFSINTSVSPEIFFPHICPYCGMILGEGVVPPRYSNINVSADNSTGGFGGWFQLTDSKEVPTYFDGHAVLDEGKRIILHSEEHPNLYAYDVEAGSWDIYSESFGLDKDTSAFVDGILYYLDYSQPGILFGLDVSSPDNLPKKVIGLDVDEDDDNAKLYHDWIPQPKSFPDMEGLIPNTILVSLGGGKLAAIWSPRIFTNKVIDVCCSRIRMSKVQNDAGGVDYVACPLSRSLQYIHGRIITDVVAVNNTTGSINRNRYKDHMSTAHPGTKI